MKHDLDATHDPALRSWVQSAQAQGTPFPIQNLPLGCYVRPGVHEPRVAVAIGDELVDVVALLDAGLLEGEAAVAALACRSGRLNELMALGRAHARALRARLSTLLSAGNEEIAQSGEALHVLLRSSDVEMVLPAHVGDYTDFYASVHHATNVGSMFRPDNPLLPNYKWIPIGYHGRASSIVVSGTTVPRPWGQTRTDDTSAPSYGPTRRLDYELEVGVFVGAGNELGQTVPLREAEQHLFGVCLVNDWSARDVQAWEYQPLGPFLAKSFATSLSPWIVTFDALAPFRCAPSARPEGDPQPLPHLAYAPTDFQGGLDLQLEVLLSTQRMREAGVSPHRLSQGSSSDLYWTLGQMFTHHTSNGCNLRPGDLLASGTVSGPKKENRGCLLELSWRGSEPIALPNGEERRFLEDGDEVIVRGGCAREGFVGIGLGECRGLVVSGRGRA